MATHDVRLKFSADTASARAGAREVEQALKGVRAAEAQASTSSKSSAATAQNAAREKVAAAIKTREALQREAAAYRQVASSAVRGSREQVTASKLATDAERRLASATATTTREAKAHNAALASSERSLGRATRGALAGSGAFHHLGRSLAFASGSFLGAAGLVRVIEVSIERATDLQAAVDETSVVFDKNAKSVEAWSKTLVKNFGLASEEALVMANDVGQMSRGLGVAPTQATKMSKSIVELAANIGALRHTDPAGFVKAFDQALAGRTRGLKSYGIFIDDVAIKAQAMRLGLVHAAVDSGKLETAHIKLQVAAAKLSFETKKYGAASTQAATAQIQYRNAEAAVAKLLEGKVPTLTRTQKAQAVYAETIRQGAVANDFFAKHSDRADLAQKRLRASLQNAEEELGSQLLPTVTKVANALADWMGKTKNQERLQADFKQAIKLTTAGLHALWDIAKLMKGVFDRFADAVGGSHQAIKLLIGAMVIGKVAKFIGMFTGPLGLIAQARAATGAVNALKDAILALGAGDTLAALAVFSAGLAAGVADLFANKAGHGTAVIPGVGVATSLGAPKHTDPIVNAIGFGGKHGLPVGAAHSIGTAPDWEIATKGGKYFVLIEGQWYPISALAAAKGMGISVKALAQLVQEAKAGSAGGVSASGPGSIVGPAVSAGVQTGRVDMGVDYSGAGYVLAVADGKVTWLGTVTTSKHGGNGPFMIYDIGGGRYVYVAEEWKPLVGVGASIKKGQPIGRITGHIEIGWAAGPKGNWNAAAIGPSGGGYTEGQHTAEGQSFLAATTGGAVQSGPVEPASVRAAAAGTTGTRTPPAAAPVATQVVGRMSAGLKGRGGADLPAGWAEQVLDGIGAPHTPGNIAFLQAWQKREGGSTNNSAAFNPLCTTQPMPGSVSMNKVGVQAYISWDQGLEATVKTLTNGKYPGIVAALQAGGMGKNFRPTEEFAKEFMRWSGGSYASINVGAPSLVAGDATTGPLTVGTTPKKVTPPLFKGQRTFENAVTDAQTDVNRARGAITRDPALRRELEALGSYEDAINAAIPGAKGKRLAALKKLLKSVTGQKQTVQNMLDADAKTFATEIKRGTKRNAAVDALLESWWGGGVASGVLTTRGAEQARRIVSNLTTAQVRAAKAAGVRGLAKLRTDLASVVKTEKPFDGISDGLVVESRDAFGRLTGTTTSGAIKKGVAALLQKAIDAVAEAARTKTPQAFRAAAAAIKALDAGIQAGINSITPAFTAAQQAFSNAFQRVSDSILTAFDRETQSHIAGMQAASQAAIDAMMRAGQQRIQAVQEAAQARIARLQEALQARIKKMQADLKRQTDALEARRAQLTPGEGALAALQEQRAAAAAQKALADAQKALADAQASPEAGTPEGQKAIADAQEALNNVLLDQQEAMLQKQAEQERAALDKSIQAQEDSLQAKEQAQEEQLSKAEAAQEASIQKAADAQAQAIQDELDAKAAQMQAEEAMREQNYQDERDGQRQLLETELAQWEVALADGSKSVADFVNWLNGQNATGKFGTFLPKVNPVTLAAQGGAAQGSAFAANFIRQLAAIPPAIATAIAGNTPNVPGAAPLIPGGLPACFAAGTPVATPDGERPIEQIREGDVVLCWDFAEQREVETVVTGRQRHQKARTLNFATSGAKVVTTADHLFWTGDEWRPAGKFSVGNVVAGRGGTQHVVAGKAIGRDRVVYNIHVEHHDHNYFACGLLVHNKIPMQGGGKVPGTFVGRYDTVTARLTQGEHVADRELTQAMESYFLGPGGPRGGGGSTVVIRELHTYGTTPRQVHDGIARGIRPYLGRVASYRSP